jgi:hypothetical protein
VAAARKEERATRSAYNPRFAASDGRDSAPSKAIQLLDITGQSWTFSNSKAKWVKVRHLGS